MQAALKYPLRVIPTLITFIGLSSCQQDTTDPEHELYLGGGYEGTHHWIDPKREFVGVIVSQIFSLPESGSGRDGAIRQAVYQQLVE